MVEAVAHCHSAGFCHRDVKLENFLLDRAPQAPRPVLIDFGFASPIPGNGIFKDFPGSCVYACPDIRWGRPYNGISADVWALGVVLYTMLYFRYPFDADQDRWAFFRQRVSCDGPLVFNGNVPVSQHAIDLLGQMLRKKSSERPSTQQILDHPFFGPQ